MSDQLASKQGLDEKSQLEKEKEASEKKVEKAKKEKEALLSAKPFIGKNVIYRNKNDVEQPAVVTHVYTKQEIGEDGVVDLLIMTRKGVCNESRVSRSPKLGGTPSCWSAHR